MSDEIDAGIPSAQRRAWSARFVAARPEHHDPYLAELHAERAAADREVDEVRRASGLDDPPAGA